ncbi:MAG TPA: acyl-CoA dehydrogenase family protein [Acidimicrobiales bacterium]|nr:acyl-CoA dehydrogenase family protein [Acidimicrobiales bacterium]
MSYEISAEQEELRSVVGTFLAGRARPRASYDGGPACDRELWDGLAQMGTVALSAPVDIAGAGGSLLDEVLVAEELGRHLANVPVVAPVVAAQVLGAVGGSRAKELLARMTEGDRIVVPALSAARGFAYPVDGREDGAEWRLTTRVDDVLEGAAADLVLVAVPDAGGVAWLAVEARGPGATLTDQPSLDQTQRLGALVLASAPGHYLGHTDRRVLDACLMRAWVVLGAEATGAAAAALALGVGHAKQREQFGQPIGRFQAVKHRLANMLIELENARSAVYNGAWALDGGRSDGLMAAHMAKAVATENAVSVVHGAIQVHGGIGFTWEHDLHLLMRRAKAAQLALGSPDAHFVSIADDLYAGARSPVAGARP